MLRPRSEPICPRRWAWCRPSPLPLTATDVRTSSTTTPSLTDTDFLAWDTDVTGLSLEVWERTMAVNLRSQVLTRKHAIPLMVASG